MRKLSLHQSCRVLSYIVLTLSTVFYAQTALAIDIVWQNPAGDKSIYYLGMIFGNVSTALAGTGGNNILGNLFNIFNIAVLTLGSLVVSYTIILSAINTAQEGELMGKKWSSMWIPLRSAIGVAFLLPTASGYSLLQILLMNIVVMGIAAANTLWQEVINTMEKGPGVFGQVKLNNGAIDRVSSELLNAMVCAQVYNYDPICQASIGNKVVSAYTQGDSLYVGVQGDVAYNDLCGSVTAGSKPREAYDQSTWEGANLAAFAYAASYLANPSLEIYQGSTLPGYIDIKPTTSNILKGAISAAPLKQQQATDRYSKEAIQNGWLFAGSYYYMIINRNRALGWEANSPTATYNSPNTATECTAKLNNAIANIGPYLEKTELSAGLQGSSGELKLDTKGSSSGKLSKLMKPLNKEIMKATRDIIRSFTKYGKDPVSSMQQIGAEILSTAEFLWITTTVITFGAFLGMCSMAGMQPLCPALGAVLGVVVPILVAIIGLLWAAGAALAIYLPLIPYLVFTFTSIGWLILVIEAMAAAPIIALGLVSPSQEVLGRASPSVLMITSVFLKPSLMVIGFIAAAKLVQAAVAMLNYGFLASVEAGIGYLGIFGSIALIVLYAGILVSVMSECFSLIHVLPDKIIRWIGGQAEQSAIKEKLGEAKKGVEEGAKTGGDLMKGSALYAGEAGRNKIDKDTGKKGGGGAGS